MPLAFLILFSVALLAAADPQPASADLTSKPAWATAIGKDQYGTWADLAVAGVTQKMRYISPGTFLMGITQSEMDAEIRAGCDKSWVAAQAQHTVTLTKGFWLADSDCNQAMWQAVMLANPSHFIGDPQCPVETVSWDDCQEFLDNVNVLNPELRPRLPTEAEWEYACRAGSTGLYNGSILDSLAWYKGNSGLKSHPVKQKVPNAWGLFDMHGNVWQWCSDWFGAYPGGTVRNPTGPESAANRVYRGGGWDGDPFACRSAIRGFSVPSYRNSEIGFRICISAQPASSP
jgi:sulfatase modifying factor 1